MSKIILIVEDDGPIRETLREILESEQYQVREAENGQVALEYLRANLRPSLILLDLMMPVMDGSTFRSNQVTNPEWAKIPVVVISAHGKIGEQLIGDSAGLPFIRKPLDIDTVIGAVKRYAL